ncbi:NAD(P)/FAD-dependent oxidoreductase [Hymenobacter sp. ASUV-10]|uniref:NAD(P)/FAD-dependent oxidoreductase n=1 Tax=Hymenobacter aranciens TaxID=3063996 RepID=A0ABT9B5H7_9BACT|nr:NAD(P)/FAD-dependent oxidoreductase [Hymenobacter sp. ASUV-10]MDO7873423.1 NAD(P)/FAD-dependent oxidoreductase [Hymenobacter sp. ASUV-10]
MAENPIIIIGAGLAGLACANWLHRAGRSVLVLEAKDAVGGRVRTDVVDGFRLDRGFQVLLTDYPEARRMFDYGALDLKNFRSGAVIRLANGQETTIENPLQRKLAMAGALRSPIGDLPDKLRILSLARHVQQHTPEALLARPATDTLSFLRRYGWSEHIINSFFRPFFGGVFLDRSLSTASNFFEFVFQQFVKGEAAIPALGMQQLPEQLAARLPKGSIRLNTRVETVEGNLIRLAGGETLTASAVVLAVDGSVPAALVLGLELPEAGRIAGSRRTTCTYFATEGPSPGKGDQLLRLNSIPSSLAHNVAFPSDVSSAYAPTGQSLISVSTHGDYDLSEDELTERLRSELTAWFGPQVKEWRHLRTYKSELMNALPEYLAGAPVQQPLMLAEGLYRCGDWASYPSSNAALGTGRQVAEMLLEKLPA